MNWYIVQAYSGFENKVADNIKDIMSKNSLENNLGEILVPTHKIVEVKKGKRTKKEKKYFPGYVLVKLDLDKGFHSIKKETTRGTRAIQILSKQVESVDSSEWAEAYSEIFIFKKLMNVLCESIK